MKRLGQSFLLLALSMVVLFACASTDAPTADNEPAVVYATQISFKTTDIVREVGEEIALNRSLVAIEPWNANNVQFSVTNTDLVTINEDMTIAVATNVGTTELVATANNGDNIIVSTLTLNIVPKTLYATNMAFEHQELEVNFDETATNFAFVTLTDESLSTFANYEFSQPEDFEVSYGTEGVVTYNPVTGAVVPLTNEESVQSTTVTVTYRDSAITNATQTFEVTVTNFVYATDFVIEGVTFATNETNQIVSEQVVLFTNSTLNLGYAPTPNNANVLPTIASDNEQVVVIDGVVYTNSNTLETANLTIELASGKNSVITKIIPIRVVQPITEFEIALTDEAGNTVQTVWVGETYTLTVSTDTQNQVEMLAYINDLQYEDFYTLTQTAEYGVFEVVMTSGNFANENLMLVANDESYLHSSQVYSNSLSLNVYDKTYDYGFITANNDVSIVPNEAGKYALFATNQTNQNQAQNDGVYSGFETTIVTTGVNTLEGNFEVYLNLQSNEPILVTDLFENEFVQLQRTENGFEVYAFAPGEFSVLVQSLDADTYQEQLDIIVEATYVQDIAINQTSVSKFDLYLLAPQESGAEQQDLSVIAVVPSYAYYDNVQFVVNNADIAALQEQILLAQSIGQTQLVVTAQEFSKQITVNVYGAVTSLQVQHNEDVASNEDVPTWQESELQTEFFVQIFAQSAQTNVTNGTFTLQFVDENNQVQETSSVVSSNLQVLNNKVLFTTQAYGTQKIYYAYSDAVATEYGYFILHIDNPYATVLDVSFAQSNVQLDVNLWETNTLTNALTLQVDNAEKPIDETAMFVSSSYYKVSINKQGEITIDYEIGTEIEPILVTILATYSKDNQTYSDTYTIYLYYEESVAHITNVQFEDTQITVSATDTNPFINTATLTYSDATLNCYDTITFVSDNDLVLVNATTGEITLDGTLADITEQQQATITATVTTQEGEVAEYSYEVIIENVYTEVSSISFEQSSLSVNLWETNEAQNELTILFNQTDKLWMSDLFAIQSDNELVSVADNGAITIHASVGTQIPETIITITAAYSHNSVALQASYTITVYYNEPLATITDITFVSEVQSVNAYAVSAVLNGVTITYSDDTLNCYDTIAYQIQNNVYATINPQTGQVTFTDQIDTLTEPVSVVVSAVVSSELAGESVYSYTLQIRYEIQYDAITALQAEWETQTQNLESEQVSFVNTLTINNGVSGVYDYNLFEVSQTQENITVSFDDTTVTVVATTAGEYDIVVVVQGTNVETTFAVVVTDIQINSITTQTELLAISGSDQEFVLANDIALDTSYTSINNFAGTLIGGNYTISGINKPLFGTLLQTAVIKDLNLISDQNATLVAYNTESVITNVAVENYGTIDNVSLTATILNSYDINMSGFVFANYGTIKNSSIQLSATNTNTGTSNNIAAFVFSNYGKIEHSQVTNTVLDGFYVEAGFVYINYASISDVQVSVVLRGSATTRKAGFAYYSKEGSNSTAPREVTNIEVYVEFDFTSGTPQEKYAYAFVGNSTSTTYTNCYVEANYNNYSAANLVLLYRTNTDTVDAVSQVVVLTSA